MNELAVIDQKSSGLSIPDATVHLMQSELAESTRLRYKRISKQISAWLGGQMLNDALLARYITEL